ncbi:uncharacterized protein LOC126774048 isoform X2 [Nymphalis io]|uniref:uncharacterized protein LOC126774048 isoform X2 n=1 Tax=Inachis io TaxID=171585 RepID=UPI00216A14C1|nr:uncharacterized protein LOC126774048 isoform X2 [Nymphalis io]
MTNVKLKLMFYLLNSLLSADLVHSRPYSNFSTTDIIMNFSNNSSTFNIPVDSNSDTLIVASEEETPEETNKSSNTQMEAIVNAEQDRDEAFSENNNQDQASILEISKNEAEAFEKQLNISSPLLDEMINSESDREGTLTDILFRPDSEFVEDTPRFEFLIAAKINGSDGNDTKEIVFSDNNLDKRNRNVSDVLRKVDYVELVEVIKPSNINENKSAYNLANITAHNVDNDVAPDTSYTDVQTLFLACFATLLPLLMVLFATLLVRCMLRRWCPTWCKKPTDSSISDSSEKHDNNHQQLKSSDEGGTDVETPPANGSIFTMTLKNNHLIVETEERNDITKNGRETKMKYSPDNDGIFVVEVQQSTTYRSHKSIHNSPPHDPQISTNQALIHRVPEDLERKVIIEEDSERSSGKFERQALALSSTGLSISDLSMSSIGSHNISYSYSSQMGYDQGPFGYPVYAGYDTSKDDLADAIVHDNSQEPLIGKTPTDPDKPVVTAAIFKQDSIIGNDMLQGPGYSIEGSTDGPLLSDVQAREFSLQHLHDMREKKLENGVAIPISDKVDNKIKTFNRVDSLPVTIQDETEAKVMETIVEDFSKEVIKGVSSFDNPPMITITEESESAKSDSTS